MSLTARPVLCSNCGFLGWLVDNTRSVECSQDERKRLQSGESSGHETQIATGEYYRIHCHRTQWILSPKAVAPDRNWVNVDTVRQVRKCPYYMKYQPGFGPQEHKELKRETETRQIIVITGLSSAAIGAAAAIIAQLLYILFVHPS
jgi:hypothetical protein